MCWWKTVSHSTHKAEKKKGQVLFTSCDDRKKRSYHDYGLIGYGSVNSPRHEENFTGFRMLSQDPANVISQGKPTLSTDCTAPTELLRRVKKITGISNKWLITINNAVHTFRTVASVVSYGQCVSKLICWQYVYQLFYYPILGFL